MNREQVERIIDNCNLPDSCNNKEIVETHISWLLITDRYVFKIKKPVRFSFLDYSTVEKRKHYCYKEIELNKRLTEGVYLDVLAVNEEGITENADEVDITDYAVMMNKLDREKQLDRMIENNMIRGEDISGIARELAAFHKQSPVLKNAFDSLAFSRVFNDINNVSGVMDKYLEPGYKEIVENCIEASEHYLNRQKMYLNQRVISGFIRDGHGDLNIRNIFINDEPVIIDCVEFNDDFRKVDVLCDIAFLAVDLDFYGLTDLNEQFYNDYTDAYGVKRTADMDRLLAYYKCYRANVRAKVSLLRLKDDTADMEKIIPDVMKYIEMMDEYRKFFAG